MKLFSIRTALTLALVAGLSACAGGKATFPIAGTVQGLVYDSITLTSGGQSVTVKAVKDSSGAPVPVSFSFPTALEYGQVYTVAIDPAKVSPKQNCAVANPTDTAGRTASINVAVICTVNSFALGGTITVVDANGKAVPLAAGLQLANGSTGDIVSVTTVAPTADPVLFSFRQPVEVDQSYGVVVLAQPTGQTCQVVNGTGIMPNNAVTTITVTCKTNT